MAKKKPIEEAPLDEFVYQRDSVKSMDTIKHELKEQAIKEAEEEKKEKEASEVTPKEEEKPTAPVEETSPEKPDAKEDVAKMAREEAEKATAELKKEIDEIKGQNLSQKEEEKAIEEAKTTWAKEGRNPKDYDEIVAEAEERAFRKATKWFEEQEKKKAEEASKKTQEEQEKTKQQEDERKTVLEKTEQNLAQEIKELEEGGYIPKVVNENDENDEGLKVRRALFQKGIEINNERIAKNLPAENSIAKVFFMHFKGATSQPAGADAPVSGNRPTATSNGNEKPYIYARDHNKTLREIMREEKAKYTS